MSPASEAPGSPKVLRLGRAFVERAARIVVTGFVIIVPFVVLIYLLDFALGFVRGVLEPVIRILEWAGVIQMANLGILGNVLVELGFYEDVLGFLSEIVAVVVLVGLIVLLGVFASFRSGERTVAYIDAGIAKIPGIGAVYRSLRQMGDVVLESGLENFRSVKLVEFPHEDLYALAFETNRAPESVKTVTALDEMVTLFVPLAPNPVMGGFLLHAPPERVHDIDMSVEEAARALVTSGIAAGEVEDSETPSLNPFHRVKGIRGLDDIVASASIRRLRDDEVGREGRRRD